MKVLLVRPMASNERFGLGPFFRIEPLGLEYIASALQQRGHEIAIYDLRFSRSLERILKKERPRLVGIATAHTLDTDDAIAAARRVKEFDPDIFTLIGGHGAAAYPRAFAKPWVDGLCFEDGEEVVPNVLGVLENGGDLHEVAGLAVYDRNAADFVYGPLSPQPVNLDQVPLPARTLLKTTHRHYLCVQRKPVYLVETARGCPYRCSFCSIWQHMGRTFRCRSTHAVVKDFELVGENIFVADDLFWYPTSRSEELACALVRRGIRKKWTLVQTRADVVARNEKLLELWRPVAKHFDIFFGFESPTDQGLERLSKDFRTEDIEAAIAVCRTLDYGITGNFIIGLDWEEKDFHRLWDFTDRLKLHHLGYTILTPLPGTAYFERERHRIREQDWSKYDMHHALWEPRLGRRRFFELFAETWRRSALHIKDARGFWALLSQIRPGHVPFLLKVMKQTRRLFNPEAYLAECFPTESAEGS